jgi:hypothetical protein
MLRVVEKIDDIFTNMNCPESVKLNRLKTWLRKIRRTMAVDIDRVARYAVLKGCREVVTYLSDREKADLKSRDVLGRSAIFYAASCMEFPMLETVTSIVGDQIVQAEMDRHDSCGFYPLHYAVEFSSIEVIEFCLLHGADVDTLSLGLLARLAEPAFSVLLELYRRPRPYLEYPIHIVSYGRRSKVWGYEKIKGVQAFLVTEARKTTTNAKSVTWIHVPWTNVSWPTSDMKSTYTL